MARTGILQRTRTWLIEALGGSALGAVGSGRSEDAGWRPITERVAGREYRRDLSPLSQEHMLKLAHYLYGGNALAQFLINIPVALTVGRSVGYTLDFNYEQLGISREAAQVLSNEARRFLDPWWEHPAHDFKGRATRYAKTYLVTGEVLLLVPAEGINPTTGLPMLDYVDSQLIEDVHGKNGLATTPGRVLVKRVGATPAAFDVILPGIPPKEGEGSDGQCFFFRHVGRLNSLRGVSDLVGQADWIDLHDQLLFGRMDKALLANTLVHDLTIEDGHTDKAIDDQVTKFLKALKPGGVWGHNQKIKHEVKTADLKEADNAALLRAVLLLVLGSKGYPEHWFAEGDNANKATSGEQTEVAFKVLEELQEELLGLFAVPLQYAYDQLAEKQRVFPRRDTGVVRLFPNLPKISERDITRIGGVVANVEAALDVAVESGRVSRSTAQRVTLTMIEKITGEHVDADDEAETVAAEMAEREKAELKAQADSARRGYDKALKDGVGDEPEDRTTEAIQIGRLIERAEELVAELRTRRDLAEASLAARPAGPPAPIVVEPSVTIHQAPITVTTPEPVPITLKADINVPQQPPAVVESTVNVQPAPPTPVEVRAAPATVVVQPSPPGQTIVEATVNVPAPQPTPVVIQTHNEVKLPDTLKVAVTDVPETEQTLERDEKDRIERTVTRPRKPKK